jgi:hypothetical protein
MQQNPKNPLGASRPLDYVAHGLKPLNISDGFKWNCSFDPRRDSIDLLQSLDHSPGYTEVKMAGDKFVSAAVVHLLYYGSILADDKQKDRLARQIKGFTSQEAWLCVIAQQRDDSGFAGDLEDAVSFLRHGHTQRTLGPFFRGAVVLVIDESPELFCPRRGIPRFRSVKGGEYSIDWKREAS